MRKSLEELFLRLIRAYTNNTPLEKGKYRLYLEAVDLCREQHRFEVRLADGRGFLLDVPNPLHESVFFLGEYESFLSEVSRRLICQGDVCFDVGANFGWYTSLMAAACGLNGQVHAFEPVPSTFEELRRNFELWGGPSNVRINNLALGDHDGSVLLNVFSGLTTGHASIGKYDGRESVSFECRMTTLDSYCASHSLHRVDFAKVDIEGAERMFLEGASTLFLDPPVFLMEMARLATVNFGYLPNELLSMLSSHADYQFYLADEDDRRLIRIEGFAEDDIGGNVFCIPQASTEKLAAIRRYIADQ